MTFGDSTDPLSDIDDEYGGLTQWAMWDNDFEEERRFMEELDEPLPDESSPDEPLPDVPPEPPLPAPAT